MESLISPYQPIDEPIGPACRHVETHFETAPSTFASDKPLRHTIVIRTLFDAFGVHPAATSTGQHKMSRLSAIGYRLSAPQLSQSFPDRGYRAWCTSSCQSRTGCNR